MSPTVKEADDKSSSISATVALIAVLVGLIVQTGLGFYWAGIMSAKMTSVQENQNKMDSQLSSIVSRADPDPLQEIRITRNERELEKTTTLVLELRKWILEGVPANHKAE